MDYTLFLHKNCISFDVNQLVVCEHTRIVRGNTLISALSSNEDGRCCYARANLYLFNIDGARIATRSLPISLGNAGV